MLSKNKTLDLPLFAHPRQQGILAPADLIKRSFLCVNLQKRIALDHGEEIRDPLCNQKGLLNFKGLAGRLSEANSRMAEIADLVCISKCQRA